MATGRRRGRAIIYIALILILLLVLVFALARYYPLGTTPTPNGGDGVPGQTIEATPTEVQNVENIVVTTQDVRRGQELTDDLLAVVAIPREQYTEGVFFKEKTEVVGSRVKFDLQAHTPVTSALIVPPGSSGSILSFEIPPGMVAISIPISRLSSVSYGFQKGDRVNVIASIMLVDLDTNYQSKLPNRTGLIIAAGPVDEGVTNLTSTNTASTGSDPLSGESYSFAYQGRVEVDPTTGQPVYLVPSEAQRPRLVSQTLIQDVVILQTGTYSPAPEPAVADAEAAQPQAAQPTTAPAPAAIPEVVTLIVNPQDAVSLNYLMLSGASLNLVLRGAGDDSRFDSEAATLQFILDQYNIPNPAKLPYGTEPRIDEFPRFIDPFPDAAFRATPAP